MNVFAENGSNEKFRLKKGVLKSLRNALFFAHANGIPSLTYKSLFTQISQQLNCLIICYDMRGMGKTQVPNLLPPNENNIGIWEQLTLDHIQLFFSHHFSCKGETYKGLNLSN